MFEEAILLLKSKKYITQMIMFTAIFMIIYTLIDSFNMPYESMAEIYGGTLVFLNIFINIIMSLLSAVLMSLNAIMVRLKGKESMGSNMSFISILFGVLTYGCTPCVIAFFANIGITFSVAVLPWANLPYKLGSLFLILVGLWWTKREIDKGVCKVKI